MRALIAACLLLASSAAASAQTCKPGVLMTGMGSVPVKVTLRAGERLRGTLICLDNDVVVLGNGTRVRTLPLADVARIVKPPDPLWNGIAIGAAIGLWFGARSYSYAEAESGGTGGTRQAPYVLSVTATFAALGATVDWFHGSSLTIYASGPQPSGGASPVGWRIGF